MVKIRAFEKSGLLLMFRNVSELRADENIGITLYFVTEDPVPSPAPKELGLAPNCALEACENFLELFFFLLIFGFHIPSHSASCFNVKMVFVFPNT